MRKQSISIARYTALRDALAAERTAIIERLHVLDAALGGAKPDASMARVAAPARLTMREGITQVLKTSPKRVRDVVAGLEEIGFRFTSKNPYNSVGAYLYGPAGRKHFKSSDGLFSARR